MATICATATAVPPYRVSRDDAKQLVKQVFQLEPGRLAALLSIFDNAMVEQRHSVLPFAELVRRRSLGQASLGYQEHALGLGRQVAAACLERAGVAAQQVDMVISVSCTGYMIPSLDAYLARDLGLRPDVRRLPITELGCVAGAMALSRAREFVRAFPQSHVLVVAVELPTLTLQHDDHSQANLVAAALFGDGAAAALLSGHDRTGPRIVDTCAHMLPDTLGAMGYDLRDDGFHMVLSKEVPELLRDHAGPLIEQFLLRNGLRVDEVAAFLLHPGGRKILEQLEQTLGLPPEKTAPSWQVLRDYGNLSSVTVLFILHEWVAKRCLPSGSYGLAAGFGPGLSTELLLLQWS